MRLTPEKRAYIKAIGMISGVPALMIGHPLDTHTKAAVDQKPAIARSVTDQQLGWLADARKALGFTPPQVIENAAAIDRAEGLALEVKHYNVIHRQNPHYPDASKAKR